jgi:hypothetical protein
MLPCVLPLFSSSVPICKSVTLRPEITLTYVQEENEFPQSLMGLSSQTYVAVSMGKSLNHNYHEGFRDHSNCLMLAISEQKV